MFDVDDTAPDTPAPRELSQDVQAGLNVLEERQRAAREQMPHLTLNDYPEAQ